MPTQSYRAMDCAERVHVASFYGEPVSGKLIVTRGMNFHRIEQRPHRPQEERWEVSSISTVQSRQLGTKIHIPDDRDTEQERMSQPFPDCARRKAFPAWGFHLTRWPSLLIFLIKF